MAAPIPKNLATATAQGNLWAVKKLISEGADVNQRSKDGMTALSIAAFWGYADIAKALLENGADINAQNSGTLWTALHSSAFQGHGPVILKLMSYKPNLSIKDHKGRTSADFASAADAIWPLFAANGCRRTPKQDLIKMDVIEKVSYEPGPEHDAGFSHLSRPGSAYVIRSQMPLTMTERERDPQMEVAAITGDVLAATPDDTDYTYQRPSRGLLVFDN